MLIMAQIRPAGCAGCRPSFTAAACSCWCWCWYPGDVGKGAQRWLDIGLRFQPSEVMKLGVPLMLAWLLHDRPLPPSFGLLLTCFRAGAGAGRA